MKPERIETENCVSNGIGDLRNWTIVVTQFSPAGRLGIGEKFIKTKFFDILIGIDKIFVVPEKWAKKGGEIEKKTDDCDK